MSTWVNVEGADGLICPTALALSDGSHAYAMGKNAYIHKMPSSTREPGASRRSRPCVAWLASGRECLTVAKKSAARQL